MPTAPVQPVDHVGETTFYSMELLRRGEAANQLLAAANIEGGMVNYLRDNLQIIQVGWRDTIIARPPSPAEREFFGLSEKVLVAIFEFRRTSYARDHKPIRFTVTVYPADRNQFEMEAGDVLPDTALLQDPPVCRFPVRPCALCPASLAGASSAVGTTTPALEIANNRRRCPLPRGASSVGVLSSREEA
jgi:UTRA domain